MFKLIGMVSVALFIAYMTGTLPEIRSAAIKTCSLAFSAAQRNNPEKVERDGNGCPVADFVEKKIERNRVDLTPNASVARWARSPRRDL